MEFCDALVRMQDWAPALENWVQASDDDLRAAYECAVWILDHRPEQNKDRALLRGPRPRYDPKGVSTLMLISGVAPAPSSLADVPFRPRQVYAKDIAAAEIVIREIERHASKLDRQILRLLAGHSSTRAVAQQVGLRSHKTVRERRDGAWADIRRGLSGQPVSRATEILSKAA
jgi:hypothetical protein